MHRRDWHKHALRIAFGIAGLTLAVGSPAQAQKETLYWTADVDGAFFDEANFSTVPDDVSQKPAGNPVVRASNGNITNDVVVADTYSGMAVTQQPGGPARFSGGGVDSLVFDGNTVALSGLDFNFGAGDGLNTASSPDADTTLDIDRGADLSAVAVRDAQVNLMDTSNLLLDGGGNRILEDATVNFASSTTAIRLNNQGPDSSTLQQSLNRAAGFEFQGQSISQDDLSVTQDPRPDALTRITAVPTPGTLPTALALPGGLAMVRRRRRA